MANDQVIKIPEAVKQALDDELPIPVTYYCPQCGHQPETHNDIACGFRFFHDTVNHEFGWIPDYSK